MLYRVGWGQMRRHQGSHSPMATTRRGHDILPRYGSGWGLALATIDERQAQTADAKKSFSLLVSAQ
jgi:hypothetical protein